MNIQRGLRIVGKYVQVRLTINGRTFHKNFGPDCPLAREYGLRYLLEKRHEIRMHKFGIEPQLKRLRFRDVVPLFMKIWSAQKNGDGTPKHDERGVYACSLALKNHIVPYFGNLWYDAIRPTDVENWRDSLLKSGTMIGTSVNRTQVPLSSIFTIIDKAIKLERIAAFKVPAANPCAVVEKAETRKRSRILTDYEMRKIHLSFDNLKDPDGWEICLLAYNSVLSEKDLRKLELGSTIDLERAKTGVSINIPITILKALNWHNWRKRWETARKASGVVNVQFRDFRKTGINELIGKFGLKLVSQYAGHASEKTTEGSYVVIQEEKMRPLANHLKTKSESL